MDIESFLQQLADSQLEDTAGNIVEPIILLHTQGGAEESTRWESHFDDLADESKQWAGLWVRAAEHTERISLIVACCQGLAEIDKDSLVYAASLVEWLIRDFISNLKHSMGENEYERDFLAV